MRLWEIEQDNYLCSENRKFETIFTLANGYRGMRGVLELSCIQNGGNYIAGVFNKGESPVSELVNIQDPLKLNIYCEDELIILETANILSFNRKLNMKEGILYTNISIITTKGRLLNISIERFVSKNNVHRWAAKYTISSSNFSGHMFIENLIDGTSVNNYFDPMNKVRHLKVENAYDLNPGLALVTSTIDKGIRIIEASRLSAGTKGKLTFENRRYSKTGDIIRETNSIRVNKDEKVVIYKLGVTYSTRDKVNNLFDTCNAQINSFAESGYEEEKKAHIECWNKIWQDIDINIEGDNTAQRGLRFNLYQLASLAYEEDDRVSIAAKGMHGEGYKGHVFWDTEIFMMPFFTYTKPEISRSLLMYRYNTLEGARRNACLGGYKGARYPWEAADEGLEETPKWGYDDERNFTRIYTGDEEFHINSDIVYAMFEYFRASGDKNFLLKYGLEIILETAKFWQSKLEYNSEADMYEINCVIGPDEFHLHVDNNAFTNYMAKWSLRKTLEFIDWAKKEDIGAFNDLCCKLDVSEADFKSWDNMLSKIYIPITNERKLIEQFEGYFELSDIVICEYDENGMPLWPELNGEPFSTTQLIKQADVIQLFLLLHDEFDDETIKNNYQYYERRTMHKSSLSQAIYSIIGLAVGDTHNAYKYFIKTLYTDLSDNQGNTDIGLHAASTGGAWLCAVYGFGGFSIDKTDIVNINPWIPEHWNEMKFSIMWKGSRLRIEVTQESVKVQAEASINIKMYGKDYFIEKGREVVVFL